MKSLIVIALLLSGMALADPFGQGQPAPAALPPDGSSDFRQVLEQAGSHAQAFPECAQAWEALSRAQLAASRPSDAVESAERAVSLARHWLPAHLTLARAYRALVPDSGRYRKLVLARQIRESLEAAVALEDAGAEAHFALMRYHLRAPGVVGGSKRTAQRLAKLLAERDPVRGALARGLLADSQGEPGQAIAHFQAAAALPGSDPALRQLVVEVLGEALIRAGEWNQALAVYQRSTIELPEFHEAWYRIGQIAAETGQSLAEGANDLKHYLTRPAMAGTPGPEQAHYQLGRIYAHQAQAMKARDQFQLALEIDPELSAARAAIQAL